MDRAGARELGRAVAQIDHRDRGGLGAGRDREVQALAARVDERQAHAAAGVEDVAADPGGELAPDRGDVERAPAVADVDREVARVGAPAQLDLLARAERARDVASIARVWAMTVAVD